MNMTRTIYRIALGLLLVPGLMLSGIAGTNAQALVPAEDGILTGTLLAGMQKFTIESSETGETYLVMVNLPPSYAQGEKDYPLLLSLDANYLFGTMSEVATMQALRQEAQELIVVSVGTNTGPGGHGTQRLRDYMSAEFGPFWTYPNLGGTPTVDGLVAGLKAAGRTPEEGFGGAELLQAFILNELLPQLHKAYRIDMSRAGLAGHSGGGAFTAFAMMDGTLPFSRYIIGSPALFYDQAGMDRKLAQFKKSLEKREVRAFAAFGGAELTDPVISDAMSFGQANMQKLAQLEHENFEMQLTTIEGEWHASVFAHLFSTGLHTLWPAPEPVETATQEQTAPASPVADQTVGDKGMVVGTTGAAAVQAGVDILKNGGNAMDAALATAMAQTTLAAGNWVSFAGIMTIVYYDAATDKVYNMNASYNTVAGEDDPLSIPGMDMGNLMSTKINPSGRATLVPGFMKGVEAGHQRFGKAPWADLFAPSIKLAEDGIRFNAGLVQNLTFRENVISRRPETKAIFTREDGQFYQLDDNFKQLALANTLRKVAADGDVDHLYTGAWAEKLIAAVQEEGGKMTMEDLANYEVIWSEPVVGEYAGHQVYSHGLPATGGMNTIEALNILEASNVKSLGHYTESPEALFWLTQITRLGMAGFLFPDIGEKFGPDMSPQGRLSKAQGEKLWNDIKSGELPFTSTPKTIPMHSDTIATVDQWGNMLGMVHSINTISWGMTGIFVDGISVPDSAALQQYQVAAAGPGVRLPDATNPGLVMKDGKPLIAHGSIGIGLHQKTIQMLHSMLDFGMSPDDAANAPAFGAPEFTATGMTERTSISAGRFNPEVVEKANAMGAGLFESDLMQGGWSAVMIEPESQKRLGGVSMVWALTPDNDSRPVGY